MGNTGITVGAQGHTNLLLVSWGADTCSTIHTVSHPYPSQLPLSSTLIFTILHSYFTILCYALFPHISLPSLYRLQLSPSARNHAISNLHRAAANPVSSPSPATGSECPAVPFRHSASSKLRNSTESHHMMQTASNALADLPGSCGAPVALPDAAATGVSEARTLLQRSLVMIGQTEKARFAPRRCNCCFLAPAALP